MSRSRQTAGYGAGVGPWTSAINAEHQDRALVKAARCNTSNFNAIIERYQDSVSALILRTCGPSEVEDLTQDVFIRAFCSFKTFEFRDERSLRTWLHRIAVNTAINALRSRTRRRKHEGCSLDDAITTPEGAVARCIPDLSCEPYRLAERAETRSMVHDAICGLSPKHQEALVLIDIEGLEYSEAAEVIGCQIGTLKSRLARAREALASRITYLQNCPRRMCFSSETLG